MTEGSAPKFVLARLTERRWRQADLPRETGLDKNTISDFLTEKRGRQWPRWPRSKGPWASPLARSPSLEKTSARLHQPRSDVESSACGMRPTRSCWPNSVAGWCSCGGMLSGTPGPESRPVVTRPAFDDDTQSSGWVADDRGECDGS